MLLEIRGAIILNGWIEELCLNDSLVSLMSNIEFFSSLLGAADIALQNIYECAEAMSLDVAMNTTMEENLFSNFPAIFHVEDSYLSLASTNTVDGIFYCLIIKVDLCDGIHYIARYFEYGAFTGFYQSTAHEKIKMQIECNELLPYSAYTEQDISLEKTRQSQLFVERESKGRYLFNIKEITLIGL